MSFVTGVALVLQFGVGLAVFALGLKCTASDALRLVRSPERLLNSIMSMYVAMPVFAVSVALATDLPPAVKIALVTYAISPTPPLVSNKARNAGGDHSYALGLLIIGTLLSIVFIPLAMELLEVIFRMQLRMTAVSIAGLLLTSVLAPLAAGMAVRTVAPIFSARFVGPAAAASNGIVIAALVTALIILSGQIFSVMDLGAVAALAAFGGLGLIVGHALGGPRFEDRTVLALYTSARHPGVAIAISQTNFPDQRSAIAAILLAVLLGAVLALPYIQWAKRYGDARVATTV